MFIVNPYIYGSSFTNEKSLLLDGVDEGASLSSAVYNGQTNFSASYWFKIDQTINTANVGMDWARHGAKYNGLALVSNQLRYYVQAASNAFGFVAGSSNLTANTWHHVVIAYNGGGAANADRLKMYIDGSSVTLSFSGTIPSALTTNALTSHQIPNSASLAGINPMSGNIDEVAYWDGTTLTSGNVTDIYNSGVPNDLTSLSPSHWWRFGDGTGDSQTTIFDQIGRKDLTGINLEAGDIVSDVP
jgi:hypothetical protein